MRVIEGSHRYAPGPGFTEFRAHKAWGAVDFVAALTPGAGCRASNDRVALKLELVAAVVFVPTWIIVQTGC
jgi:hypothetical protein